jgi:hypothetical protein
MSVPSDSDIDQANALTERILELVEQQGQTTSIVGNALIQALAIFLADICEQLEAGQREAVIEHEVNAVRQYAHAQLLTAPEQTGRRQ